MSNVDALAGVLSAEFEPNEVLHFEGRGGRIFDYIEDETVMDRLDLGIGLGAAGFEFSPVTDTCVKGRMTIRWPDGTVTVYEDFGYATRADSAEPYKEAVSDAIRRLGRYVGVARYLYRKHDSVQSGGRPVPSSTGRPPARPTVVRDPLPGRGGPLEPIEPEMPPNDWEEPPFPPIGGVTQAQPGDICEEHNEPWRGEVGDLYHGPKPYHRHPLNIRKARGA